MIYIIGLGAGDVSQMQLKIVEMLNKKLPLYLRTNDHPMISYLNENQIPYQSFDSVYEKHNQFLDVYEEIIEILLREGKNKDIVYAVPGHPCVAEYAVKRLMEYDFVTIVGGQSFLDAMFSSLKIDPIEGLIIMDALNMNIEGLYPYTNLIIPQIYDQMTASNVKLDLMEVYPDEHLVTIVIQAGTEKEQLITKPLYELDHDFITDNLTTLFVPKLNVDNQ